MPPKTIPFGHDNVPQTIPFGANPLNGFEVIDHAARINAAAQEATTAEQQAQKQNSLWSTVKETVKNTAKSLGNSIIETGKTIGEGIAAPSVEKQVSGASNESGAIAVSILRKIAADKKAGKDTSRLEEAYNNIAGHSQNTDLKDILPTLNKSNFEIVMDTLGAGADLISAGGGRLAEQGVKKVAQTAGKIIGKVDVRAGGEAAQHIAQQLSDKTISDAVDIVRPRITPKLEQEAFKEGRVGSQGLFKGATIAPSPEEQRLASSIQPLIENGDITAKMVSKDPSAARDRIFQEVSRINQGVKEMVRQPELNQPFTNAQLEKRLADVTAKSRLIFASETTEQRAYDAVVSEFRKYVQTNNVSGLLDARQAFDAYVRKNFPKAFEDTILTGNVNPRVQALRDVRSVANEMAADLLDSAQIQKATRIAEPKTAKALLDTARKFEKPEDFIRQVQQVPQEGQKLYPYGDAYKLATHDLQELWDIAHANKVATAGRTYTQMLRNESDLLTTSENIATKIKGITTRGKISQFFNEHQKALLIAGGGAAALGIPTSIHAALTQE